MQTMGIGWAFFAITLIALGMALVLAELMTDEAECFAPGAVFFLITGSALWFFTAPMIWPTTPVWLPGLSMILLAVTAVFSGISLIVLQKIIQLKKQPPRSSEFRDALGKAIDSLAAGQEGYIHYHGEYWRARNVGSGVNAGQVVRVLGKDGLLLLIEPETDLGN